MLFASLANAAVVYTYTGNNFNEVFGGTDYSTSNSVSGSFTVASAFPANMPPTDVREQVLSYSFTDGVNTFNESNSEVCLTDEVGGFGLGTDSNGDPYVWIITLCTPVSAVPSLVQVLISANLNDDIEVDVGTTGSCTDMNEDGCTRFDKTDEGGQIEGQPGTWASPNQEASAIPTLNTRAAILVATLLGLTGLVAVRRRKIMGSK
jgi:hypothetical protein